MSKIDIIRAQQQRQLSTLRNQVRCLANYYRQFGCVTTMDLEGTRDGYILKLHLEAEIDRNKTMDCIVTGETELEIQGKAIRAFNGFVDSLKK